MPSWKKIITSGSDASLRALFVTNAVTSSVFSGSRYIGASFTGSFTGSLSGSLFGTSSFAVSSSRAVTSSFAISSSFATSASFALTSSFISTTGTNAFVQGGNSFGATATIGTNDAQSLVLESNGTARVTLDSSGNTNIATGYQFSSAGTLNWGTSGYSIGQLSWDSAGGANNYAAVYSQGIYNLRIGTTLYPTAIFVTASSGNVGIGTTSPVSSTNYRSLSISGTNGSELYMYAGSTLYGYMYADINGMTLSPQNSVPLTFRAGGSEHIRLTTGGNVGIGTTSPSVKLQISSSDAESMRITGGTVNGLYSTFFNGTIAPLLLGFGDTLSSTATNSDGVIRFNGSNNLLFSSNGAEIARFNGSGNLGIGITNPTEKITSNGNLYLNSNDPYIYFNSNYIRFKTKTDSIPVLEIRGSTGGSFGSRLYMYAANDSTVGVNLNSEGNSYFNGGNVGIGTTSPGANLQIGFQNSSTSEMLRLGVLYTGSPTQRGTITWHDSADVTGQIDTRFDGSKVNMYFGSLYNNAYNSTVRLTILGDGNVGIGTTTPTEGKLVIANSGPSIIYNKETSQGVNSFWNSSDGSQIQFGAASAHPLLLFTNNSEKVRITSDGNVGIGINSPTAKLDVASSTTGTTMVVGRYSGHPNIKANTDAGGYLILDSNGDAAAINHYVASNVWLATGGGNVGINTTSPGYKLDVAGTTGVTTQIRTNGADWVTGLKIQTNNADGGYFYTTFVSGSQYASLQAGDNSTYRNISLNHQGGNIGIGITTPATKLHIQGSHTTALFRLYSTGGDGTGGTGPASVCMWASEPGVTYNGSGIGANINNSPYYGRLDSSNGQSYIRFTPADIQFYTGAGDASFRATILSTGRFGIGTTSPQKPFEVISDSNDFVSVGVNQIASGSWTGIHFGYREANNSYRKSAIVFERTDLTSNDAQGKIHILNGPQGSSGNATLSDARLTIGESGNVGINKTSPTYKLDIVGAS
jgi:hypothetical protein